jgi:hypothetical protein
MLSATAGAFDDAAIGECESIADAVEQDSGEPVIGSPIRCGTSLIVCPVATWSGGDLEKAVIAPTPGEETNDTIEVLGPSPWELVSCWLPEDLCTLPPATFSPTGDDETIDSGDPIDIDPSVVDPVVDPGSADDIDSGLDPVVIVDPPVDPIPVEPLDIRVQFVSSGEEWACYYYYVGLDGAVRNVSVLATSNEPTIAAFVADHADDGSFSIQGSEWGWSISGFPLDLAPPVPETGVFAVPDSGDPTDETVVDPIPDGGGLTITDRERVFTAPNFVVCDGDFVPGEYPPIGSGETTDVLAQQQSVAVDVQAQAPAPASAASFFSMPTDLMAAVAANSTAAGSDTPLPFGSGRRRR